jgi:hypothetical protein
MTYLDLSNQVVSVLLESPVFTNEHFAAIKIDPQYEEKREALIRSTLRLLESAGLIKQADSDFWMLTQPLGAMGQDIHLSAKTASFVADVINTYLAANKVDGDHANALSIGEEDILMLVQIIGDVISTDPDDEAGEENGVSGSGTN